MLCVCVLGVEFVWVYECGLCVRERERECVPEKENVRDGETGQSINQK